MIKIVAFHNRSPSLLLFLSETVTSELESETVGRALKRKPIKLIYEVQIIELFITIL